MIAFDSLRIPIPFSFVAFDRFALRLFVMSVASRHCGLTSQSVGREGVASNSRKRLYSAIKPQLPESILID